MIGGQAIGIGAIAVHGGAAQKHFVTLAPSCGVGADMSKALFSGFRANSAMSAALRWGFTVILSAVLPASMSMRRRASFARALDACCGGIAGLLHIKGRGIYLAARCNAKGGSAMSIALALIAPLAYAASLAMRPGLLLAVLLNVQAALFKGAWQMLMALIGAAPSNGKHVKAAGAASIGAKAGASKEVGAGIHAYFTLSPITKIAASVILSAKNKGAAFISKHAALGFMASARPLALFKKMVAAGIGAMAFLRGGASKGIGKQVGARAKTRAAAKRDMRLALFSAIGIAPGLAYTKALFMALIASAVSLPSIAYTKALNLALLVSQQVRALSLKRASKAIRGRIKNRGRIAKGISAYLIAKGRIAAVTFRSAHYLKLLFATAPTISILETVARYARALAFSIGIRASRNINANKPIRLALRLRPRLNRHWGIALMAKTLTLCILIAKYNKRYLGDLARRVLAPLRRQPYKP